MATDKPGKTRPKISILTRIAVFFLAAFLLSTAITMAIDYQLEKKETAQHVREVAAAVGTAVQTAIGSKENLFRLMKDEKYKKKTHKTFQFICRKTGARYLYLYTVGKNDFRDYIILAAPDDADDAHLNKEIANRTSDECPLYDAEKEALSGAPDGGYEFMENEYGRVCMYVMPVTDGDGNVLALIGVDYSMESIISRMRSTIINLIIMILLLFACTYAIALLLIRHAVIQPIALLSDRMQHFVENRKQGSIEKPAPGFFEDEISDIEKSFDKMTEDISNYVGDIKKLTQERIEAGIQLDITKKIQGGIVPVEKSHIGTGYEVFGFERPAKHVGGDFYDIFKTDEDTVCVVVGDISGKGISAAFFMILVKTTIKEHLRMGRSLADALDHTNREICLSNPENMFATVFAMTLNTKSGTAKYVNAGHTSPILVRQKPEELHMKHGVPIGLFDDATYEAEGLQLQNDEAVFIYTDGVTEAINEAKEQFSEERLINALLSFRFSPDEASNAHLLVKTTIDAVEDFSKGQEQFDDITCVAMIYKGNTHQALAPAIESFKTVKKNIFDSLGENEKTRKMILACEEIFSNIVNYSTADNIGFASSYTGSVYSITFSDNGIAFDPTNAKLREKEFEELDTGGMGISIARKNSDEMVYGRVRDKNYLKLNFNISNDSSAD